MFPFVELSHSWKEVIAIYIRPEALKLKGMAYLNKHPIIKQAVQEYIENNGLVCTDTQLEMISQGYLYDENWIDQLAKEIDSE